MPPSAATNSACGKLVPNNPNPRRGAAQVLARTFDSGLLLTPDLTDDARTFLTRLLELERNHFEAVMRAIRKIVDATYLVEDDPSSAYTQFVAALESLAQLDSHVEEHSWDDYPKDKAKVIETAVEGLTEHQAAEVRDAVLEIDQLALRRRFAAFTRQHVRDSFYREEAADALFAIRAVDLPKALDKAYALRSKNIHELRTLAPEMYVIAQRAETVPVGDIRALGLEGLNRLTRHVVRTFVDRAPTSVDPSFDWQDYLPGKVKARLAPELWIGNPDGLRRNSAEKILDGFLSMLLPLLGGRDGAGMVDMRPVLERIEALLPGESGTNVRVALVALYELWDHCLGQQHGLASSADFLRKHLNALDGPSLYAFVVRVITGHAIEWGAAAVVELAEGRRALLLRRSDQDLPVRLDATLMLAAAVLLWDDDRGSALGWISNAVEILPGDAHLIAFELSCRDGASPEIDLFDFAVQVGLWRPEGEPEQIPASREQESDEPTGSDAEQGSGEPAESAIELRSDEAAKPVADQD
jgi:hypothetical protein